MSCRPRGWLAAVLLLLVASGGCARRVERRFQRLAVVRFENLSGDTSLDWTAAAIAPVVAAGLTGSPNLKVSGVSSLRELPGSGANLALHGYLTRESGKLTAHAVLEDAASGRVLKHISTIADDPLPIAGTIARAIDAGARPFGTRQPAALRAYLEAVGGEGGAESVQPAFERAVAADPDFGDAYVAWAQWLLARSDRAGAERVFAAARQRGAQIDELSRTQLDVLAGFADGAYAARRQALVKLARLTPADGSVFARLGALDVANRQFGPAVEWYWQALEREPDSPALLNELGYASAYKGDLDGAVGSLRRYEALRPKDANPLDSLGDVHFLLGRFRDAEPLYLAAQDKDPGFGARTGDLAKAARARLMSGDTAGANAIFARYLETRRSLRDPMAEFRLAQWEILAGSREQAAARLEKMAAEQHPAAWLALTQLGALSLDSGDRERARQYAVRALTAPGGRQQPLAAVCAFVSQPSAPADEWRSRAEKAFPDPRLASVKTTALGLALLFDRRFADAVTPLRQAFNSTPPSSAEPAGVFLGWALVEAGQAAEAKTPLALCPAPQPNSETPFAIVALARLRALRSR